MGKVNEILEFNKIKENILKYNINELSKKRIDELEPCFIYEVVDEELAKCKEGYKLVTLGQFPSLGSLIDITNYLDLVSKNALLTLEQIYDVYNYLDIIARIKSFMVDSKILATDFPYTFKYVASLYNLTDLKELINYCVSPNFTLYDNASSKLKEIRTNIKKIEKEIKDKLNSYLKTYASILSDNYIASRGSHLVLPVKASEKSKIPGIVIDVSATNQTLFIEPMAVIEGNAKLESLHYEEELEIERIIKNLCVSIYHHYNELMVNLDSLSELSLMILKGSYGLANNYEVASLNNNHEVRLIDSYHPLLNVKSAIKNDFYLGGDSPNIIVISGPNAGGKTVYLKTIGLLAIMNQCGLPLPIKEGTLPLFSNIFVEIGDEQSIEASLSGFSSSMSKVSDIINHMDKDSLVIIDELGSKTDPYDGEALAKAIIEEINETKAISLISTHYLGIKDYASNASNIMLASMGFNEDSLLPTYKINLNMVGRSYALEISERLGLKKKIIDKARSYRNNDANKLDLIIDELSNKLKDSEMYLTSIKEKEKELKEKVELANIQNEKLQAKLNKALDDANYQKEKLVNEANNKINAIVASFKESLEKDGYKQHLKNNAINELNSLVNGEVIEDEEESKEVFNIGDNVRVKFLGKTGIIKEIKGNKVTLDSSNTRLIVSINDLEKVNKVKESKKAKAHNASMYLENLKQTIPLSLNIIGCHVDEALAMLKRYLDSVMLVGYHEVSIIHGYGTGALRKAVHEYLKTNKYVEDFHLGGFNEGGSGSTTVIMKVKKK